MIKYDFSRDCCPFCCGEAFDATLLLRKEYDGGWFDIYADKVPIIESHKLVITKKHVTAFSFLGEHQQLNNLKNILIRMYADEGGEILVVFEHGSFSEPSGGCGIYHAHWHVVSIKNVQYNNFVNSVKKEHDSISMNLEEYAEIREPYLLIWNLHDKNMNVFFIEDIQSQYLRRKLAEVLGVKKWNWRLHAGELI